MPPQLAHMLSLPQTWPVVQPGQGTGSPQLSVTVPHLLPEQVVVMPALVQLQVLLLPHVCGDVQSAFEQQLALGMQADPQDLKPVAQA